MEGPSKKQKRKPLVRAGIGSQCPSSSSFTRTTLENRRQRLAQIDALGLRSKEEDQSERERLLLSEASVVYVLRLASSSGGWLGLRP